MQENMKPGQLNLNELEVAILQTLSGSFPAISGMIKKLSILSREYTCVGSYTNFNSSSVKPSEEIGSHCIGIEETIHLPNVPSGLGGALFCEDGKPKMLELFTYGDEKWDGTFQGFNIEKEA